MALPSRIGSADQKKGIVNPASRNLQKDQTVPCAVRCSACHEVGIVAFEKGFNLKLADKVMNKQVIKGNCSICKRERVEFIPIPLNESDKKEFTHLYNVQETLQAAADKGWHVPPNALIFPLKKLEDMMKRMEAYG